MRKTLTIIAFSITGLITFAQQDAQFSMNMFNRLAVNPGYAGMNQALCATFLGRNQWTSFPGSPQTGLLSVDYGPVLHGGLGLTIDQDKLGFDKTLTAKLAYSYHLSLGSAGILGIGVDGGIMNKSLDGDFIAPDGSTSATGGVDNAIPWTGSSSTTYDVGFGLYFQDMKDKLYVGLSCLHLAGPAQKFTEQSGTLPKPPTGSDAFDFTYEMARNYYVMAGYKFQLAQDWTLTPSIFAKSDASSTQIDINALVKWNNMVFAGVSYRTTDAIPLIVGFEYRGFKLGYAYDVTLSAIKDESNGTNEIMLGYCHKFVKPPRKRGHDDVRHF